MTRLLSFSVKNIKRKPTRTAILVFAIGLLVSALVFSLSFVQRVNGSIRKASERLGADLIVVPTGARGATEEILLENKTKSFYMDRSIMDRVAAINGVAAVTEQVYLVTLATLCCSVPEAMVVAYNQDTDFIVGPWLIEKLKRKLKKGEAVAGSESSFNIRLGLVDVDSKLFGSMFKIVGTMDKTGTGLDNAVFITTDNLNDIIKSGKVTVKPGQISLVFVKVNPGVNPATVAAEVENTIIDADAMARKDIGKNIIATLKDMSRIFTMTIILAAIMSFFLVWAIFTAIANERAKEVGIMRSIGAKESHIMNLYLAEVVVIGVLGSVLGILFGSFLSVVLAKGFTIVKQLSTDLSMTERSLIALASFVGGMLICVLGALGPIQRLKKMEPLTVIKAE